MEKAYSKKYGSYGAIEGGLTHLALSELTNGIPEAITIDDSTNQQAVW